MEFRFKASFCVKKDIGNSYMDSCMHFQWRLHASVENNGGHRCRNWTACHCLRRTSNTRRIENAKKATSEASKASRISRRGEEVAENDAYEEAEGLLYAPGIDDWCKYAFFIQKTCYSIFERVFLKKTFFRSAEAKKKSIKQIGLKFGYVILIINDYRR